MRVPLICLLLSCTVALSRAGIVLIDGAPILWAHTAAQASDLPSPLDAWDSLNRMSFSRILLSVTDQYMTCMGPGENQSPLWGLPLQLGWMISSGRLADPTGATTCGVQDGLVDNTCISPISWWGCVNYFSSIIPFLSASKNGFLGSEFVMQTKEGFEGYCTTYETCKDSYPDAINKWDAFFSGLKASVESTLPENEKKDAILGLYWGAQLASTEASSACAALLNQYTGPEKAFAQSWQNAGNYVAAVYFQSSLDLASQFMTPLPGRVLKEDDVPPNIGDLSKEENHSLYIFSWMKSADTFLGGTLVSYWRSAMCSVAARESGRDMLSKLLLDTEYATASFISIVTTMSTSCGS